MKVLPLFTGVRGIEILGSSLYQADPLCSGRPLTIEPGAPLWGQNGSDLIAVVAPFCIKGLRLVPMQLPEKFSPTGLGTNQSSHIRVSRKFVLTCYEGSLWVPFSRCPSVSLSQ